MLKIYGNMQCPDCQKCREALDRANVEYEYRDFTVSLLYLKEFLALRDSRPEFEPVKQAGSIGIPCILREDGSIILDWETL